MVTSVDKISCKILKLAKLLSRVRRRACKISLFGPVPPYYSIRTYIYRLVPGLKTIVHQCVISYTVASLTDGSILSLNRAIRVRLATSI